MARHIHADNIIIAANDTSIEWQSANPNQPNSWVDVIANYPSWSGLLLYRQKPKAKKTVDMWQWAFTSSSGNFCTNGYYYKTADKAQENCGDAKMYRIEGSKITIQVEE